MSAERLWRIEMLGGLRLEGGGEVVTRFRSQKIGHLLAFLALFSKRVHTREELADLLWPDADGDAAKTNLRTALSSLRRQLEPPGVLAGTVLVTRGHSHVSLNPAAFRTDVAEFDHALTHSPSEADLLNAVRLYRGPLMPGCYETWALTERERLAGLYLGALRTLTHACAERQEWTTALDWAQQAVAVDPLEEAAHGDVIRVLLASGQAAAARRHFEEMARLLDMELGMEPSAETRALLDTPLASPAPAQPRSVPPTSAPSSSPPQRVDASLVPKETSLGGTHHDQAGRLPLIMTRFFGREEEVTGLADALREARLVTLTGPGGAGKTRLAVEAARALAVDFSGGVWFVPLADLRDGAHFFDALAGALGLPGTPAKTPQGQVVEALGQHGESGPLLLILDNMEQIVEDAAPLVALLLADVPRLRCLVTSRHHLLLEGERDFPLSLLPVPQHGGTPERLLEFASVQLFVNRAQAVRPDFQLTRHNAAAVAALCVRLEGIPLALELAAAWSQTLSPAQMLTRMQERHFDLLVSRRRDIPARHAALRGTIEWSYDLLSPELKTFFTGLSVFRGGWNLDAAEQVCGEPRAWEYLAELQDRSLVLSMEQAPDAEPRLRMLETLREFAREQSPEAERTAHLHRHANYYLALAEEAREHLNGADPKAWLDKLAAEQDNFRAVLDASVYVDAPEVGCLRLRLAGALARFWEIRGVWREGSEHLARLLTHPASCPQDACRALQGAATLARLLGDYDAAEEFCERGLELARSEGDDVSAAAFLGVLGIVAQYRGAYVKAEQYHRQSLALSRRTGNQAACAPSLHNLGRIAELQGEFTSAASLYREAVAIFRAQGDRRRESMCLSNVGNVEYVAENYSAARQIYEHCLAMQQEIGHEVGVPISLFNLGCVCLRTEDLPGANDYFCRSLRLHWEQGNRRHLCLCFEGMAAMARQGGEEGAAACLLAAADTLRVRLGSPLERGEEVLNPIAARARAQEAEFRGDWEAGKSLSLEQAVAYALRLRVSQTRWVEVVH